MPPDRPVVVIACKVLQDLLKQYLPQELSARATFMDYGLHLHPKKLAEALQEQIDSIQEPSLVVLGYGLCGNGLHGLHARQHTLLIPRADDCIAILLGSKEAYQREFTANPGTYYLTKGWLESGSDPLREYESIAARYDPETAEWIMDQQYQHYRRLLLVAHTQEDLDAYRPRALEVARYCERWGMRYQEILGTGAYVRRLAEAALDSGRVGSDFLLIPPGGTIDQSQFQP